MSAKYLFKEREKKGSHSTISQNKEKAHPKEKLFESYGELLLWTCLYIVIVIGAINFQNDDVLQLKMCT